MINHPFSPEPDPMPSSSESEHQPQQDPIQTLLRENAELKTQLAEREAQVNARQKLNERQRQDIETLQTQVEEQQLAFAQERRQWEKRQQDLQTTLVEAQDLSQKRIDMLQRFKAELSLARTQIAESQEELSRLKSLYGDQQAAWIEQREHLEARLAGYAETETEWEQRRDEERQMYIEQIANTETARTQLSQEVDSLTVQLLECQHQLAGSEAQRLAGEEELLRLNQQFAQLQVEVQELQATHQHCQTQLAESVARSAQLEAQLDEYQIILPDLLATQSQVETLHTQQTLLQQTLHDRETRLQSVGAAYAELQAEVSLYRDKLAEQQLHNLHLKAALDKYGVIDKAPPSEPEIQREASPAQPATAKIKATSPHRVPNSGVDLPRFRPHP